MLKMTIASIVYALALSSTMVTAAPDGHAESASARGHEREGAATVPPIIIRQQTGEEEAQRREELADKRASDHELVVLTAILAIATIALGVATIHLARSTKQLVQGADANAERQLRAYITVKSAAFNEAIPDLRLHPKAALPDPLKIVIQYANSGQTPATDVGVWAAIRPQPNGDPAPVPRGIVGDLSKRLPSAGAVGSSDAPAATLLLGGQDLDWIRDAAAGNADFYVAGTIVYRDIFGKTRASNFCNLFRPHATNDFQLFVLAEHGNEVT